jgi:hypothetical protein
MGTNPQNEVDPTADPCSSDPVQEPSAQNAQAVKRKHHANEGARYDRVRLQRAEELFLGIGPEGAPLSTREIEKTLCKEWGCVRTTARRYLKQVRDQLAKLHKRATDNPDAFLQQTDAMFLQAFKTAQGKGDASSMVQATQRRAEAFGWAKRDVNINAHVTGLGDLVAQGFAEAERLERERKG